MAFMPRQCPSDLPFHVLGRRFLSVTASSPCVLCVFCYLRVLLRGLFCFVHRALSDAIEWSALKSPSAVSRAANRGLCRDPLRRCHVAHYLFTNGRVFKPENTQLSTCFLIEDLFGIAILQIEPQRESDCLWLVFFKLSEWCWQLGGRRILCIPRQINTTFVLMTSVCIRTRARDLDFPQNNGEDS